MKNIDLIIKNFILLYINSIINRNFIQLFRYNK